MSGFEKFMSRLGLGKAKTEEVCNQMTNHEEVSSSIASENANKQEAEIVYENKDQTEGNEQIDSPAKGRQEETDNSDGKAHIYNL